MQQKILGLIASSLFLMSFSSVQAEECELTYNMQGWSFLYKTYKGHGLVVCPSGKRATVYLNLQGGGMTFGASEIIQGTGKIRGVNKITDIYGDSFALGGHIGFIGSIEGRWVPRGERTVTLNGTGSGFDLGWSMGSFNITKQ